MTPKNTHKKKAHVLYFLLLLSMILKMKTALREMDGSAVRASSALTEEPRAILAPVSYRAQPPVTPAARSLMPLSSQGTCTHLNIPT